MTDKDRRARPRLPAEQTVQLIIPGTTELSLIGDVEDLSRQGMRLIVGCEVEVGSAVQIALGDSLLLGEVRYCQPHKQGFALGIELEPSALRIPDLVRMLR